MPVKRWQHVNICSLITKRKKKEREKGVKNAWAVE